jgi:hypothetical protein
MVTVPPARQRDPVVWRVLCLLMLAGAVCLPFFSAWRATQGPRNGAREPLAFELVLAGLLPVAALLGVSAWIQRLRPSANRVPSSAGLLRLGFYLFTVHWAWMLWSYPNVYRHAFEVHVGLPAAALCVAAWIGPGLLPKLRPRPVRLLDIAAFNLCLTPWLFELGLRLISLGSDSLLFETTQPAMIKRMDGLRLKPGQILFGFPADERGFHDQPLRPPAEHERLVVMIGDSFGVGIVPQVFHYTTEAERQLPWLQVYNMAISAVDVPEYRYLLTHEALALKPDLIVIGVFVGNDLQANNFDFFGNASLYAYLGPIYDRRGWLLHQVPWRLSRLMHEREQFDRVGLAMGEQSDRVQHTAESLHLTLPYLFEPRLELPGFTPELFDSIEQARAYAITDSGPDAEVHYNFFFREFESLRRAAGSTPLAVVLIPDEYQVEDELWERIRHGGPGPLKRFQPQERLVPWFAQQGVPCLDLLPILRAEPRESDGDRHLYHVRDTHFNRRGNRRVGQALAEFLRFLQPELAVARIQAPEGALQLTVPGLPVAAPLRCFDQAGLELPLKALLPGATLTSSDPEVVQITSDGRLVPRRLGLATVRLEVDGRTQEVAVEATWPPLVDLGGGSPTGPRGSLRVASQELTLGSVLDFELSDLPPHAQGSLCISVRPALGWVLDQDPFPHDPRPVSLLPFQADEQGQARVSYSLPDSPTRRGIPVYFTARWSEAEDESSFRFTPVVAITPQ